MRKRHILVPVDFSAASVSTVRFAIRLAAYWEPTIELVHAVDIPALLAPYPIAQTKGWPPLSFEELIHLRAQEAMQRVLEAVSGELDHVPGFVALRLVNRVIEGRPATVILDLATREAFDLIIVARTTKHLGSLARHLLRAAPCPVIAVPEEAA
jgi:nucleotide-binding universal stress UspA family protein